MADLEENARTDRSARGSSAVVQLRDVRFTRDGGAFTLDVSAFEVAHEESVALIGRSGCGKSTLLDLISGILRPDAGTIRLDETELTTIGEGAIRSIRRGRVGFVFQDFRLLPYLSVRENLLLPARLGAVPLDRTLRARADSLAERAGIAPLLRRRPDRLSQGERQRAAVCRALVGAPALVLADEPTGNLDPETGARVLELLIEECRAADAGLVVVTHDATLLGRFDRVVDLETLARGAS